MEPKTLPKTQEELRGFILETIGEIENRIIPYVSFDEQKEIGELYGDILNEDYNQEESVKL